MTDSHSSRSHRGQESGVNHVYYPDDEISLYELWDVLCRRWSVIAVTFLLVVTAGLAYALLSPVTYDYRSSVDVGQIYHPTADDPADSYRPIESPEATEARLQDEIIPRVRRDMSGGERSGFPVRIETPNNQNTLVLISTAEDRHFTAVQEFHAAVVEALLDVNREEYQQQLSVALGSYPALEALNATELQTLEEELQRATPEQEGSVMQSALMEMIYADRVTDLRRDAIEARIRLAQARGSIAAIKQGSEAPEMNYLAARSNTPASASPALIVALTIVLAGMLGIFAAFFTEFVSNARQRRHNHAT